MFLCMSLSESSVHDRTTSSGSNVVYRHHHTTETHKQTSSCETRLETSSYNRTKLPMLSLQTENTHARTHTQGQTTQMSPSLTPELPHAAAPRTHSLGERQTKKMEKKAPRKQNQHSLTHSLGAAKSISAIEALDSLNLRHHQSPVD